MPARIKQGNRRPDIESDLTEKYHVGWEYLENVPTKQFDIEASLTNQARFEALDEGTVEQYVESVQRGDLFPAVIAYRRRKGGKLVIVDGNHRLVAHDRAEAAISVYEVASGTLPQTIMLMTYAFNTRHGRPTSEAERVEQALYLVDNGATPKVAAESVNVTEAKVKREVSRRKAEARAREVGVDLREWDSLTLASKGRLLTVSTDEGLKDAVHLARAASLGVDEVFALVSDMNTTKSATRQRAIVRAKSQELQERIQAGAGGILDAKSNRRSVTPKARIGMVLGQIAALPEDVIAIARTYASAERKDIVSSIDDAIEKLRKVRLAIDGK